MSFNKSSRLALVGTLTLATLLHISTWGATTRDDQPDSGYLNLASSPDYEPVGVLVNSWGYTGCATLVAPEWVLTAAHNLTAASSAIFKVNGVSYSSAEFVTYSSWNGDALNGYDIALVRLSTAVVGVTPATLYAGPSEVGQTGTYVGFGFTGTGLTGWQFLDNQKRAFENVIDGDFGNPSVLLGSDFDNPHTIADNAFGDAAPLPLEGCVAPGDSGGGVFLTVGSASYLAGVISFVASTDANGNNADYGDVSGFGRVSAFVPWITSVIPEPSVSALLVAAALGLFLERRSRRVKKLA